MGLDSSFFICHMGIMVRVPRREEVKVSRETTQVRTCAERLAHRGCQTSVVVLPQEVDTSIPGASHTSPGGDFQQEAEEMGLKSNTQGGCIEEGQRRVAGPSLV